jgi:Cys-tRNA synthase (O-phospho-L-seryl-tRNA:Cys-tRNA synthase)
LFKGIKKLGIVSDIPAKKTMIVPTSWDVMKISTQSFVQVIKKEFSWNFFLVREFIVSNIFGQSIGYATILLKVENGKLKAEYGLMKPSAYRLLLVSSNGKNKKE